MAKTDRIYVNGILESLGSIITDTVFKSNVLTGTAALSISSTTVCPGLNAESVDDFHFANISGLKYMPPGDETWYTVPGYTGSTGTVGPTGARGYTGSIGTIGFTGSVGNRGYVGSRGSTGYTGSVGFTGSVGNSGPRGATGTTGTSGYQGSQGYTGSQGDKGAVGPTGYTGSVGPAGNPGADGAVTASSISQDELYLTTGGYSGTITSGAYIDLTNSTSYGFYANHYAATYTVEISSTASSSSGWTGRLKYYNRGAGSYSYAWRWNQIYV